MASYNITPTSLVAPISGTFFRVGFGDPATNSEIVLAVEARMKELEEAGMGGALGLVNGPASLPAAVGLAHHLTHRFGAVGIYDPKLKGYVVACTHDPRWALGDLIPEGEVVEEAPAAS